MGVPEERPDLPTSAPSLVDRRNRKKQATHDTLRKCALRLFAEKGFEQTTVQDITDAADVAQRTFFLHYASKDEVLIGDNADQARHFMEILQSRPSSESPFEALRAALVLFVERSEMDEDEMMLRSRLMAEAPSLMARSLEQMSAMAEAIAVEMAQRSGTDPGRDVYPQVLATAGMTALMVAASIWYRRGADRPYLDIVGDVLDQFAAGMMFPAGES